MRAWVMMVGCALVVGCGGTSDPTDAGGDRDAPAPATDGGAGPFEESATITVTGARSANIDLGPSNYISCIADASGFFSVTATEAPAILTGLSFSFRDYDGPGTYDAMYSVGGGGPSSSIRLTGDYGYDFGFNRSNVDLTAQQYAQCSLVVTDLGDGAIQASFVCSNYVATILSPDYDDRDAAGFRPSVDFTAEVRCTL